MVADSPNRPPPPMPRDYKAQAGATDLQALTAAIKAQQDSIQQLADAVGALAQCVAMLMEEEFGTPVKDGDGVETDMDGNPIK